MRIVVNGEQKEFNEQISLQNLIEELQIEEKIMAAAVNMKVIKKDEWKNFILSENDSLELLQFVGGG